MKQPPSKKQYEMFLKTLSDGISRNYPEVCVFSFGSLSSGSFELFKEGISDSDGGIILSSGVQTYNIRDLTLGISKIFAQAVHGSRLSVLNDRPDFNLLDIETARDGRFNSYRKTYNGYFKKSAEILCGPNYLDMLAELEDRKEAMVDAAFVFRNLRNRILFCYDTLLTCPEGFSEYVIRALNKSSKFPKKILEVIKGDLIEENRKNSQGFLEGILEADFKTLRNINDLLRLPSRELYSLFEDEEVALTWLGYSLDAVEEIISSYMNRFPRPLEQEIKNPPD